MCESRKRRKLIEEQHRVGQKKRLDIVCPSTWTRILNANKFVVILFIYLTLPNWTAIISSAASSNIQQQHPKNTSVRRKFSFGNKSLLSLTRVPTNKGEIRLFCRVGLFMSMDKNGTLSGVLRQDGKQEVFELQSFGTSIVRIKHKVTGLFITMNSKGKLRGKTKAVLKDYYFYLNHEENAFISFASFFYKKKKVHEMFIGIKRGGEVKHGKQTYPGQDSTQFLLLRIN